MDVKMFRRCHGCGYKVRCDRYSLDVVPGINVPAEVYTLSHHRLPTTGICSGSGVTRFAHLKPVDDRDN